MTTPRDLLIVAMDSAPFDPSEAGELSLALAAAELLDLLAAGAATLDEARRIVPGPPGAARERLLVEAASTLVRESPYEPVGDWLWRRGRDLSAHYAAALEADRLLVRQRRRWPFLTPGTRVPADSPDRRSARERRASREPVLTALAQVAGVSGAADDAPPAAFGEPESAVFVALDDAVAELEDERDRRVRRLEAAAEENRRRGY